MCDFKISGQMSTVILSGAQRSRRNGVQLRSSSSTTNAGGKDASDPSHSAQHDKNADMRNISY